ncbi:hypothetical protein [Burkholderia sp. YIM B11467]
MQVHEMFGRNGFRIELHKSGGYSMSRFGGDIRGWNGEHCCLVGFKISEHERARLIADAQRSGTLICSTWIPA